MEQQKLAIAKANAIGMVDVPGADEQLELRPKKLKSILLKSTWQVIKNMSKLVAWTSPLLAMKYAPHFRLAWFSYLISNVMITWTIWLFYRKILNSSYPIEWSEENRPKGVKKYVQHSLRTLMEVCAIGSVPFLSQ